MWVFFVVLSGYTFFYFLSVVDSFSYVGFLYDTAWGCTFFNFLCVVDSFSYVGSLWYCVVKLFRFS